MRCFHPTKKNTVQYCVHLCTSNFENFLACASALIGQCTSAIKFNYLYHILNILFSHVILRDLRHVSCTSVKYIYTQIITQNIHDFSHDNRYIKLKRTKIEKVNFESYMLCESYISFKYPIFRPVYILIFIVRYTWSVYKSRGSRVCTCRGSRLKSMVKSSVLECAKKQKLVHLE